MNNQDEKRRDMAAQSTNEQNTAAQNTKSTDTAAQSAKSPDTAEQDADLKWELVRVEHVIQDKWIDFRRLEYRFPDGSTFYPYYNFSRRNYVVIVASDEDGRYICVRQFRHGISEVTTEFVAGGIETGGKTEYITRQETPSGLEDALEAAKRELEEETGYTSDEWEHLITVPSAATIADNYAYVYRAKNCRRTKEQHTDSTEFLRVKLYEPGEIEELIAAGRFQQAVHIMAWLLAQR